MRYDWEWLQEIANIHGDTFYLLDLQQFRNNWIEFSDAFQSIYSRSQLAYSYKTNYIPKLCKIADELGGYAEVVSHMEYELACKLNVHPKKIIFNGPYKRMKETQAALLSGSIVNLDSWYEVNMVQAIAEHYPNNKLSIGLRCNLDIENHTHSRFGFDTGDDSLTRIFEHLKPYDNCHIAGLHCHMLTKTRSAEDYSAITRKMLALTGELFKGEHPDFIDLGGGFLSRMNPFLQEQFDFAVPTFQEYANAIAEQFASMFPGDGPDLILEPGISITADVMKFIVRVIDIKSIASKTYVLAAGSIYNIKPTKSRRNLPMTIVRDPAGSTAEARGMSDIVGYTCMEDDILFHGCDKTIAKNDFVIFDNVGAYTLVLKPPFILPCPPVLSYDPDMDSFETIKLQEDVSDVFRTYKF
jgi:diaminopimelate decarboxylase